MKDNEKRRLKRRERHLQSSAGQLKFHKTCSTRDAESDKPNRRVVFAEDITEAHVEPLPNDKEGEEQEFVLLIDEREFEQEEIGIETRRDSKADSNTGPAATRNCQLSYVSSRF